MENKIRLLYLEDDSALAAITLRGLAKHGYQVDHFLTVSDAAEAMLSSIYDCALLDLKIGNETSLNFLSDIKKKAPIPVVLLTGYGSIRTAVHAMKLGAIDFLSKPCSIQEIIHAFDDHLMPTIKTGQNDEAVVVAPSLKNMEWEAIQKALQDNDGNISATARQLKLHRRTLQRKLQKRRIDIHSL